mmetsp:Transcript_5275/g.6729  ORF Transcript_5275/g.6729 Transcript_5275/m.6729 type:complete len:111 (-) Transcript_5275:30-362(-)|eukprot:CAMPEP_0201485376 /NCGR_PEP_ID=MMETSP0151_2-20130828/9493_1 /ASSEMBLY_ACC=CAM_ASM_000257 /TAXON_ID=200890 /ORGANISM="Paramoeba atlantica, Strain 621/1 / CCAP 1560/9" /LENGTH=110 /DNA_ID=CAMNT_0047869485 /DNA_START=69 /DNA_END=401 /DNA_ORIENTATION=+
MAQSEEERVVMKICFEGQIRRIPLKERPLQIDEVQKAVKELFPEVASIRLKYRDPDGDIVLVASDLDLQEAYNVAKDQTPPHGKPILRLNGEKVEDQLPFGSFLDLGKLK